MVFRNTYYFANVLYKIFADPDGYLELHPFWGDGNEARLLPPFPRKSRLHQLIGYVADQAYRSEVDDVFIDALVQDRHTTLWMESACHDYGIAIQPLRKWLVQSNKRLADITEDDIFEYFWDAHESGPYEQLLERVSSEVFYLLFSNRTMLLAFNQLASSMIPTIHLDELEPEYRKHLRNDGRLRRVSIPQWVRRAVFFRDRGLCVFCHCDLSGIIRILSEKHFDHIVPLAECGLNDVTNIQLVCGHCNRKKSSRSIATSVEYEPWY